MFETLKISFNVIHGLRNSYIGNQKIVRVEWQWKLVKCSQKVLKYLHWGGSGWSKMKDKTLIS